MFSTYILFTIIHGFMLPIAAACGGGFPLGVVDLICDIDSLRSATGRNVGASLARE